MTQEFVAEKVGVSRQAVSKWEKGLSEPSTSNLIALAKVFGVSVEELLKNVGSGEENH
ncbi:helix-turn-helix transcriptional regulator [Lacrimispora saccharolytica]|nr:helix-turn-helix transcriptional regulator [Lacrimispora saccharolytica]